MRTCEICEEMDTTCDICIEAIEEAQLQEENIQEEIDVIYSEG